MGSSAHVFKVLDRLAMALSETGMYNEGRTAHINHTAVCRDDSI